MRTIAVILLLLSASARALSQMRDTLLVFFPLDKDYLTKSATNTIDSLISSRMLHPGKPMILIGYGDYLGTEEYNNRLSYARAYNVEEYLASVGFTRQDITLCIGKGKIDRSGATDKAGNPVDRKVEIVVEPVLDTPWADRFTYYMSRLDTNQTLALKDIQFYRGSLRVTPPSMPWLKLLIDFMLEHKSYRIRLEGHVCCLGPAMGQDEPYDQSTLSVKRAETICDSLVAHGVYKSRLEYAGFGNSHPLAYPEETLEDQQLNRRVEVRILSK